MIGFCVAVGAVLAVIVIAEWLTGLYHRFIHLEAQVSEMRIAYSEEYQRRHGRRPRPGVYIVRGSDDDAA